MTHPRNRPELNKSSQESRSRGDESQKSSSPGSVGLLAQVTTLAWNLVIPIVGGVLLGYYLDQRADNGLTWTLSLLVLGVLIAFSNLYNLYIEHGRIHLPDENNKSEERETHEE